MADGMPARKLYPIIPDKNKRACWRAKLQRIMQGMNTNHLQTKLMALPNITEFAQHYKLPLRTLMRIKAGGTPTKANAKMISEALTWNEKRMKQKAEDAQPR